MMIDPSTANDKLRVGMSNGLFTKAVRVSKRALDYFIQKNSHAYVEFVKDGNRSLTDEEVDEIRDFWPKSLRDFQRSKVYKWEMEWGTHNHDKFETFEEAADFARRALEIFGVNPDGVDITTGHGNRVNACANVDNIQLPAKWSWTPPVILHEVTHCFCCRAMAPIAAHGPEFVGAYMDIMDLYDIDYTRVRHDKIPKFETDYLQRFDPDRFAAFNKCLTGESS